MFNEYSPNDWFDNSAYLSQVNRYKVANPLLFLLGNHSNSYKEMIHFKKCEVVHNPETRAVMKARRTTDPTSSQYLLHTDTVDSVRIKLLYQAGHNGLVGGFLIIFLYPLFVINKLDTNILIVWLLCVLAVNIPRIFLLRSFNKKLLAGQITNANTKQWENYFIYGFTLSGLVWATIAFLPYHSDQILCLLFVVLVHVGINAIVVSTYSSSKPMVIIFLSLTLIPTMIKIFSMMNYSLFIVGIIGIAFYIVLYRALHIHNQNLIKIITLKIENEKASRKDALTGLWNRRQLYEFMDKLIPRSIRHDEPFVILLLDIDHFKQYNDTKGHTAGDKALIKVSQVITDTIRQEDLAVRYGGEEFLIVFPLTRTHIGVMVAEKLRIAIKTNTDVTVSGGLAEFDKNTPFDQLVLTADSLLYRAKEQGRDRFLSSS